MIRTWNPPGLSLFALALCALPAVAADEPAKKPPANKNKTTYTNPAETDADFPLQGEYCGTICWNGGQTAVGLQVVALGDGKFDGALYGGGLPGSGWDRGTRETCDGSRRDYGVQLIGYMGSFLLHDGRADYYNREGNFGGSLTRVARVSPTLGLLPPSNAIVLFHESNPKLDQFVNAKLTKEGYLHSGTMTKLPVQDFRMHVEFRTPYMPFARGQARGNSGVYIQQRYELQILDSFGLKGEFNECGALYRQTPPDLNMCFPPLAWQTYDIHFTAPRFAADGKTKLSNARLTLHHNGVAVHQDRSIRTKTGAGKEEGPQAFPINIQDHGNPVALRNVWLVPLEPTATGCECYCPCGPAR
jgi:hypothetical protein